MQAARAAWVRQGESLEALRMQSEEQARRLAELQERVADLGPGRDAEEAWQDSAWLL